MLEHRLAAHVGARPQAAELGDPRRLQGGLVARARRRLEREDERRAQRGGGRVGAAERGAGLAERAMGRGGAGRGRDGGRGELLRRLGGAEREPGEREAGERLAVARVERAQQLEELRGAHVVRRRGPRPRPLAQGLGAGVGRRAHGRDVPQQQGERVALRRAEARHARRRARHLAERRHRPRGELGQGGRARGERDREHVRPVLGVEPALGQRGGERVERARRLLGHGGDEREARLGDPRPRVEQRGLGGELVGPGEDGDAHRAPAGSGRPSKTSAS